MTILAQPPDTDTDTDARHIDNPLWARTATASKVPAMLGYSQYDSPKSCWLKMKYPERFPRTGNRAARRGSKLEAGFLDMWFEDNPRFERLADGEVTFTRDDLGFLAAATPDCYARDRETDEIIGVENKTIGPYATILKEFGEPGTDLIPMKYLIQGVWQNYIGGFARTALIKNGPLIDDQDTYWIPRNEQVEAGVLAVVAPFMKSLEYDVEPENDTRLETYDAVRLAHWELLGDKDPNADWEVNIALAIEYTEALQDFDRAEGRLTKAKTDLLTVLGKARRAIVPGPKRYSEKTGKELKTYPVTIATRQKKGNGVSLVRPQTPVDLDYLRALLAEQQNTAEVSAA